MKILIQHSQYHPRYCYGYLKAEVIFHICTDRMKDLKIAIKVMQQILDEKE